MKSMTPWLPLVCAALIGAPHCLAVPIIESFDPVETGSFDTGFGYGGFASFTTLEAFLVSESGQGPFESPGLTVDGSDGSLINPTYAKWTGSSSGSGSVILHLDGAMPGAMTIDIIASGLGSGFPLTLRTFWDNGGLSSYTFSFTGGPYDRTPVPDSGVTLCLLGLALPGLAAYRRLTNRQSATPTGE
ncbi:MAG: VPDSG-CTERM sorting domain-containing protein [Verrucomicrobiales bacterium]|nr:VPDSG-CTERM sorting domain-containing protein [Verrucomicrobiales bacterium]